MMDKALIDEALQSARSARAAAETAMDDVDDMIRELQHWRPGRQQVIFSVSGWDDDLSSAS